MALSETIANEREYLLRRCADHILLAERCCDEAQAALHREFASRYRQRADALGVVEED